MTMEMMKMNEKKKPKRIRQKIIKVVVTDEEKKQIEANAAQANLSVSQYARDLGLSYQPKSLIDVQSFQEIRSIKEDFNKIGGLLKNLMSGEVTDPKEIQTKLNGLLLDLSKNQNLLDQLLTKVRSKIKF
ncbi:MULTISPECIES: LysR family transcriptional regulator [unclassified Acinetobacter]|uniref:plasmid mobilization protein n=3 Tax=Moraxellaceae TaxID=468 RepID=UPI00211DBB62|nr:MULTISPECIES: LysR family transcriptional regulator [unclassified Acinetobacter]